MKLKGLQMPRHIAFSGNGSKVISILSPDATTLEKFSKKIFEHVYGVAYHSDGLRILNNQSQPKEATCKGGITCSAIQDYDDVRDIKLILNSSTFNDFIAGDFTYNLIDDEYIENTKEQVIKFINFVFDLNAQFSFDDNFGVDANSIMKAQQICYRDIKTYIVRGLSSRNHEVPQDAVVEETIFFYPLLGMLNALADEICNIN